MTTITIIAITLALLAVLSLFGGIKSLKKGDTAKTVSQVTLALSFLAFAGMFFLGMFCLRGYIGLTHEQVVATVTVEPIGSEQFRAHIITPQGFQHSYVISGDQLVIEAEIVKWKPIANLMGLHTSYELLRISGRYNSSKDEQSKAHTVFGLQNEEERANSAAMRQKFSQLRYLFDTEYGSASFVPVKEKRTYILLVSNSGLLFRKDKN